MYMHMYMYIFIYKYEYAYIYMYGGKGLGEQDEDDGWDIVGSARRPLQLAHKEIYIHIFVFICLYTHL